MCQFVYNPGFYRQIQIKRDAPRGASLLIAYNINIVLELLNAEAAVDEHAVDGFEVVLASLLGLKLNDEEVAVFKRGVVAAIDEGGEEFLLAVGVQAAVGKIYHLLHIQQFHALIFQFGSAVR